MAKISLDEWVRYRKSLQMISQKASDEFRDAMFKIGGELNPEGLGLNGVPREDVIRLAHELATKYGEASGALACEMYDEIAEMQGANVRPAEPARTPAFEETRNVINSALDRAPDTVPDETGKLVKKTATRTMRKNASRDGAFMALVPSGDGCAFCRMIASRGWEPARSSKSFEKHLHKNCQCEYVVRFGDDLEVEGYDPDALYDEFMQFEGSWDEKMNAMRREYYAANKVDINAQKRATYARNHGMSVAAGTLPDKMKKYVPVHEKRMKIIEDGIMSEKPIFVKEDDPLYKLAMELPEEEGLFTVVLHGNPYSLEYKGETIDADTLCAIIAQRPDYKKGTDIRLISCYTGSEEDGVAKYISDKLKVNVLAPDKLGIIQKFNGEFTVYSGSEIGKKDGEIIPFKYKEW